MRLCTYETTRDHAAKAPMVLWERVPASKGLSKSGLFRMWKNASKQGEFRTGQDRGVR